jgi:pimeloyl-ACP methyl ester carboxylesterase
MITGTPPVSPAQVAQGFRTSPHMNLAGKEDFTDEDVDNYARATCGEPFEPFLREVVARTDGRARRLMFEKFAAGSGEDQSRIVAEATVPLAVVNGADEPFVDVGFVREVRYASLWQGRTIEIEASGHAPFWDKPQVFDPILEQFVEETGGAA